MAIPTSKPLSLSTVQTEYGGSNPISMSEYRGKGNAPASGAIDLWGDFNGTSNLVTVSGFVYHDTWRNDSLTGTSVNLASKLNNQSTATYEERQGGFFGVAGDLCFGSNQAYATGIGSIVAVRKCTVYGSADSYAGNDYSYASQSLMIDPSNNTTAYGSQKVVGSFQSPKNLLSDWGETEAGNWLKDGMYARFEWFAGDVPWVGRTGSRFHYFYVDVDFDYTPA